MKKLNKTAVIGSVIIVVASFSIAFVKPNHFIRQSTQPDSYVAPAMVKAACETIQSEQGIDQVHSKVFIDQNKWDEADYWQRQTWVKRASRCVGDAMVWSHKTGYQVGGQHHLKHKI